MRPNFVIAVGLLSVVPVCLWSQTTAAKSAADPLGRTNPRSAVTGFLEACHSNDFQLATQYLDLRQIPENRRALDGPRLATRLEEILNSDNHFDVLKLSLSPEGDLADDPDPSTENIASVTKNGQRLAIVLQREEVKPGSQVWLFSPDTVSKITEFAPSTAESSIEARLPQFLVTIRFLDTPVWKWIALLTVAFVIIALFRFTGRLMLSLIRRFVTSRKPFRRLVWIESVIQPLLVILAALIFATIQEFISPSALGRLYTGRVILLMVVWSFAWCITNLVDVLLSRIDSLLDPRQRIVSHSLIYIGRRAAKVAIFVIGAIIVLDNWGYNMTTMIAGLGVGGIAVALAAQGTIANIFGGVSVISDHPVMVGDFGNFGGVMGTVEDIGMRSTRIRTLNRTLMSIPNSSFATINLENYALRDKILFNPTLQIKRGVPKDKIRQLMKTIEELLRADKRIEIGPSPVRLSSLSAASFGVEIFAYTLTDDIDAFYRIEADLFLELDEAIITAGVELA